MKIWNTKNCLVSGISTHDIADGSDISKGIFIHFIDRFPRAEYITPEDWHTTAKSAVERANAIKTKKLTSLKKQFEKINSIAFVVEK